MIATWQYIVLGSVLVVYLAVSLSWSRRDAIRANTFFCRLETTVSSALAPQQFVLTTKSYTPKSFGHRFWRFEGPSGRVEVFWDGKERHLSAELRSLGSPTVRKPLAGVGIDFGRPSDHQGVLDDLNAAITAAVISQAQS